MKRILLALMGICLFIGSAHASKYKKIEKIFPAVKNLKIESKYGKIKIKHWEKNEIRFEILISVDGSSDTKNETIADNISVDFTKGDHQLVAQTVLGDFFTFKKLTNSLFNKGKIKINYTVQLPSSVNLDIVQRNGSVFMDSHDGNIRLDLSNGSFTAQDLSGENKFKVAGSNFQVNSLGNSEIDFANAHVSIQEAEKLSGESRDSEIEIHAIDNLNIKSARDKFNIKEIEYLYGSSNFSKFEIAQMGGEIDFELKFGHLNVFNINNLFSFIKLDSKYGNIGLSFMQGCQMDYEINHKSVKFNNSTDFTLSNQATADKKTFVAKGKIGSKKAISNLNIRANNCKIRLE
ncbi:hypothetical protein [Ancylomarina longa]|uniref:Adhesin domain-containing protein n=1 Tax=Ancylomarina longa TaxID=2487017 RepID=A0A434AFP0_9BACT|nr:hypothetical protein [Ancylomarina longa]RUT73193.1 hypothetical protein DLK05_14560 [Ancylomarina longa]